MSENIVPAAPSAMVAWMYKYGSELSAIKVGYRMLTEDTCETVWYVEFVQGHKQTVIDPDTLLRPLLDFYPSPNVPSHRAIAKLKEAHILACEARAKWEKSHARELAEYRRLKAKFEGESSCS